MRRKLLLLAAFGVFACVAFLAGRLTARHLASRAEGRRILYYVDPMHPSYRSDKPGIAPDCGMALEPVYEGLAAAPSSLPDGALALTTERQRVIGLRVATASRNGSTHIVRTSGRVVPEDNRLYRIQAGFEGWVDSLTDTPPGAIVKKDQVLATLYGPEVRSVALNYIGFISGIERVKQGMTSGDTRSIDDSKRINEEQLHLLGMGQKQIDELATTRRTTSSLDLVAPADAIVLSRSISPYQRFEKGAELYRLADLKKVWIVADVHGAEADLRTGQTVRVNVPELNRTIEARVTSTLSLFDGNSRTLKLRLEAENPGFLLRPDMFVDVDLQLRTPPGLAIPSDAVLNTGFRKVIYVETSDDVFEPRVIDTAGAYGDQAIVTAGLREGERVVVSGNFLLDSESRMRAGVSAPRQDETAQGSTVASTTPVAEFRDPVCGMALKPSQVAFRENLGGKIFSFCSDACRRKFLSDPAQYNGSLAALAAKARKATPGQ